MLWLDMYLKQLEINTPLRTLVVKEHDLRVRGRTSWQRTVHQVSIPAEVQYLNPYPSKADEQMTFQRPAHRT